MKIKSILLTAVLLCGIPAAFIYTRANFVQSETTVKAAPAATPRSSTLKAYITEIKEALEKDRDQLPALISKTEQKALQEKDPAIKAILYSMEADLYNEHYNANRYNINRRTNIQGFVPSDIREWTSNLYADKIKDLVLKSITPTEVLQQKPAQNYREILESGEDSPQLRPSLFDLLTYRGIQTLSTLQQDDAATAAVINSLYNQLRSFHEKNKNEQAALYATLQHLQYNATAQEDPDDASYMATLDSLLQKHKSNEFSNEIRLVKVNMLQGILNTTENQDSIQVLLINLCKEGIAAFPSYKRTALLQAAIDQIEQPTLSVTGKKAIYPGTSNQLKLQYKNQSRVTLSIYRSLLHPEEATEYTGNIKEVKQKRGKLVTQQLYTFVSPNTWSTQDTTLALPALEPGLYECEIASPGNRETVSHLVAVTRLAAVSRTLPSGKQELLVTDLKSGQPLKNIAVRLFERTKNKLNLTSTLVSDGNGLVSLPETNKFLLYQPVSRGDSSSLLSNFYAYRPYSVKAEEQPEISLFTDRSLYRPGQTVFFKGIAFVRDTEKPKLLNGNKYTVTLRDANYKEVATREVSTSNFGSFSGEFTLPASVLNGTFTIETSYGAVNFDVAEYKRPTFDLKLQPVTDAVAFGDDLFIHGEAKTFSGTSIQGGSVQYRIVRKPQWMRGFIPRSEERQVANGTVSIKQDGTFTIRFTPQAAKADSKDPKAMYRYEVIVVSTDSKGESQESRSEFLVGAASIFLHAETEQMLDKEKAGILLTVTNSNNKPAQVVNGSYVISLLRDNPSSAMDTDPGKLPVVRQVISGKFNAGDSIGSSLLRKLPSGRYRIELKGSDSKNRTVTEQSEFILYGTGDKKPPVYAPTWVVEEKTSCLPGEEALFTFGTSCKQATVLYEIAGEKGIIHREWIKLSDANRRFRLPYKNEYGKGVTISFAFVKDGAFHTRQISLKKQEPSRELFIKPVTFRDKLKPGDEETWTFKIADKDSLPVMAEILAGMYDASLDKIKGHNWWFNPTSYVHIPTISWVSGKSFQDDSNWDAAPLKEIPDLEWKFDRLDWQGAFYSPDGYNLYRSGIQRMATKSVVAGMAVSSKMESEIQVVQEEAALVDELPAAAPNVQPENREAAPQLRRNFAETAFFYPTLQTNKAGEWEVKFRLPESNTTWRMMALAHTKELQYGTWSGNVVSQKELMVLPNLPRFMRKGDDVSVATQIINLADHEISGKVRLELVDPATDEIVVCMTKAAKPFTLAAGESGQASWQFPVPEGYDLLICRIIAETPQASDGEQHLLPVLANRISITESIPFYQSGSGEKTVTFPQGGSPGSKSPYSMTLEVTANPVWYAVQALPTLSVPATDNLISWFTAYVSNTIASSLAQSNPRIQPMVAQWKAQGETAETLQSKLQQNESLKQLLLKETPWVLEAASEAEQKQRLTLLFDSNRNQQLRDQAISRLQELQSEDGGWSWFKGMPETPQLTLYILKGMAQLAEIGNMTFTQTETEMINKALSYMDTELVRMYDKKELSDNSIPGYIYLRTQFKNAAQPDEKTSRAILHYSKLAEKDWNKQSLYGKAYTALLMHETGKEATAKAILSWLRKTATQSEELGMYWANNRQSGFFTSAIDTHCLLMKVFRTLSADTRETDRLKQWLLNQKRTQVWESDPATVNAIHAIIATGSDWLSNQNSSTLTWGNNQIDTNQGEAGTGYIKTVVTGSAITPSMQKVVVKSAANAPLWGALYRQYFEEIQQVTASKGALQVEKKLFVERNNGQGIELQPVTDGNPLHKGDKVIVRLTLRADRDMEYVHLKDLRAGCFEPTQQMAGSSYKDGLWMYHAPEDAAEHFFIHRLPKGTFVLEYAVYTERSGNYSGGISTIQCLYAPEFVSHTAGSKILVQD